MSLERTPVHLAEDCLIRPAVNLAEFTTFRVGGAAEWFAMPKSLEALQASYAWARTEGLPVTFLGAGSNLLISDDGLPGLVICMRHLQQQTFDDASGRIRVDAGKPLPRLAWQAAHQGWSGLEWAVGIPGTVGGAVVMNAGAHRECIADHLVEAHVLRPDGTVKILTKQDLGYAYRSSTLQQQSQLVLRAVLQLQPGGVPEQIVAKTQTHREHRLSTQPYDWPSCGSVFRNPYPQTAGWLIEQTGLKGYRLGGAQVAQKHANFILNCGDATAADIFHLIQYVRTQVASRWAVHLYPEVKTLGKFAQAG